MIRMTSWLSMTIVGAFLLSGLGGVALAPAILYSALASALLANFDNLPSYGARGVHFMRPFVRPLFYDHNLSHTLFAPRYQPRRPDIHPSAASSIIYPTLPPKSPHLVHHEFLPASNAGSANPNHVATSFVSKKPTGESPPAVLLSQKPHYSTRPSEANPVASRFVPARGAPSPTSGETNRPTLVSSRFRPANKN